jgi:hypothetical protein
VLLIAAVTTACALTPAPLSSAEKVEPKARKDVKAEDLFVVDCLLPGQVRRVGGRTYLTPRRPTRTTTSDCQIRGGEYVAYDRANYKTALKVWMDAAEQGDPEAQTNVGEIFERGLGGEPNYEAAVIWYTKAAESGNSRAQFNLGTLYEQGLGVEKDRLQALNWYRRAWGVPEDSLVYASAAQQEIETLRAELDSVIQEKDTQLRLLQKQVAQLEENPPEDVETKQELEALKAWVARLREEQSMEQQRLAALPRIRAPSDAARPNPDFVAADSRVYEQIDFGRYYALVIGNENYEVLDDLESPRNDAMQVAEVLEQKYGFTVTLLPDANNADILFAINQLKDVLEENDNLLIYYAGHGSRLQAEKIEAGYWLPVNADRPPDTTFWVPTEEVTKHIARLDAKRVMIVADSCYAGLLTQAQNYLFVGELAQYSVEALKVIAPLKSRLLLSSGGDSPVLDNGGQGHSVFAQAFLDELEQNDRVLTGPELFLKLRNRVRTAAARQDFKQEPQFQVIKVAGHEAGDFFFVPVTNEAG